MRTAGAVNVCDEPFERRTALLLGNEGQGLSDAQLALCDRLVYIPQHGNGTASLNVAIAGSIIMHRFAVWAQLPEQARTGHKYDIDMSVRAPEVLRGTDLASEKRVERAAMAAAAAANDEAPAFQVEF